MDYSESIGGWGLKLSVIAWIPVGICLSFLTQAATIVEGTVFDDATAAPLAGVRVEIEYIQYPGSILDLGEITTGSDGVYQWSGDCYPFLDGECYVHATAAGYADTDVLFDGTVPLNQIDLLLHRISTISGHVRRSGDGSAVAGATVMVGDQYGISGPDGEYAVNGVVTGEYSACASVEQPLHFVPQCFDHLNRSALGGTPAYTPLDVVGGENVADIDFDLTDGGAISGTLKDGYLNQPIDAGYGIATLYDVNGAFYYEYPFFIDADGRYTFGGMPDGEYYVSVMVSAGFSDPRQVYPGIVCDPLGCSSPTQGQTITISDAGLVDGIDFTFHPDRVISGTVRDSETGEPVGSIPVKVHQSLSNTISATTDAATGTYHVYIDGPAISYHVAVEPDAPPFIDVAYPDQPCSASADCWSAGDELLLGHGDVRDHIDFVLNKGAAVSGRVVNSVNGQPLVATVIGFDVDFNAIWSIATLEDGSYTSPAWMPGTFYVSARPAWNLWSLCAFYLDRPCPADGADPSSVMPTPLTIGLDEIRQGVDFEFMIDEIFQSSFEQ